MRTIKFTEIERNAPDRRRTEITIETHSLTIIRTNKSEIPTDNPADETVIENGDLLGSKDMTKRFMKTRRFLSGLLKAGLIIGLILMVNALRANAAAFTVNNNGDTNDSTAGNSICADSSGNCTLRAAIQEANALSSNDEIYFSLPTASTITLNSILGVIPISGTLAIYGSGANQVIVSGGNNTRIFTVNSGASVRIIRLTIANGRFTATNGTNGTNGSGTENGENGQAGGIAVGGAILNNGTLSLFKVVVRDNQAVAGRGGNGGTGGNSATNAGNGGAGGAGGTTTGGAIQNSGTLYILNSSFSGNRTTGGAGGSGGIGGSGTFSNGNGGNGATGGNASGGNIYNSGTLFITNSTVSVNQTAVGVGGVGGTSSGGNPGSSGVPGTGSGGGFFNTGNGTLNLRNATVSGNTANSGGGIFNSGTVNFGNSIIADNTASNGADFSGTFNSLGANLIENTTGATISGTTTGNITGVDPALGALQNNGGETLTRVLGASSLARNAGNISLAVDPATNQPLTLDQRGFTSRFGDGAIDIGASESNASNTTAFDFDGDGKADVAVFRPSSGYWYTSQNPATNYGGILFGQTGDKLVPADYDGDGKTDVAVVRNGTWYLNRTQLGFTGIQFGASTDIPQVGDFDGDGKSEIAVYRPFNGGWYVYNLATNQTFGLLFGASEDKPVAADYDGDGRADIAVFRPSSGSWYVNRSQLGFTGTAFGFNTDRPIPADYDGDGKTDIAVFRPSNGSWYLLQSAAGFTGIAFGFNTDVLIPADYDGDGKTDVSVFRASNGYWYLNRSTSGFTGIGFGAGTDVPVPSAFIP